MQSGGLSGAPRIAETLLENRGLSALTQLFTRFALGCGFLSAVADRFGLWGPPGSAHAVWGDYMHFEAYTAHLNAIVPALFIPSLSGISTGLEILFGIALLFGVFTRLASLGSAALLAAFACAMTLTLGVKAPLDFSVFSACAAALLLATVPGYRWSVDELRGR